MAKPPKKKHKSVKRSRAEVRSGFLIKRRSIGLSDSRLQFGLSTLRKTKDLAAAARAARTSPVKFKQAARKKRAIKKQGANWIVRRDLQFQFQIFSEGSERTIILPSYRSARLTGKYMGAVGNFLRSNKIEFLKPFIDRSVRDVSGKTHPFEINPNTLYRLASASNEPFEQIYKIVI